MNFVEPIRDKDQIKNIQNYLKNKNKRDYLMFMFGIYTGLRISDILKFRIKDLKGKDYINIRELKTRKQKLFDIHPKLKKVLEEYFINKDPDDYIFKSRQGYNKAVTRSTAYKMLRKIAEKFGIENVGTHTLRKTFGYHFYKNTNDVVTLMEIFNHSHPSVTLRYIGINQEKINKSIKNFDYF